MISMRKVNIKNNLIKETAKNVFTYGGQTYKTMCPQVMYTLVFPVCNCDKDSDNTLQVQLYKNFITKGRLP